MTKRGRTPKGEFADKLSNFSTRIQPQTRKALEKEAKAAGQSISQLAERLLITGLAERRERDKDRAMRALCFLITQLAHHIVGPHVRKEGSEVAVFDWRSDPFFYRAFKLSVGQLLDALEPPGPIEKRPVVTVYKGEMNPSMQRYVDSFKTPEARAEYSADYILSALRSIPHWPAEVREEQRKLMTSLASPSFVRELYGMPDAWNDLIPKEATERKEVRIEQKSLLWGDRRTILWSGE